MKQMRRYESELEREEAYRTYLRRIGDEGEADIERGDYVDVPLDGLADHLRGLGRKARGERRWLATACLVPRRETSFQCAGYRARRDGRGLKEANRGRRG